jgi:hypothetical protein
MPPGLTAQLQSGGGGLGVGVAGMRERLQQRGGRWLSGQTRRCISSTMSGTWPTDHVEYVSPLKGEALEATRSDGFGFPQDCGGRITSGRERACRG